MSRYYKANELITMRFYQMPKALFGNQTYKGLSLGAKATYSILRDRQDLSIKNNWVDESGYVYLNYSIETLSEILEVSNKTTIKFKRELVKYKLMVDRRMGQGKSNRMYILKPELIANALMCNKYTSKSVECTSQEVKKVHTNDTELKDTEYIDTQSFTKKENEGMNEFNKIIDQADLKDLEEEKILKQAIRLLYYSDKPLRINNMNIPINQVREDLKAISFTTISSALRDFKKASKGVEIGNVVAYLSVCVYNALFDAEIKIDSELRYKNIIG